MACHPLKIVVGACALVIFGSCESDPYDVDKCDPASGLQLPVDQIPSLGNPDAKIRISVFGDVTCPMTQQLIVTLDNYLQGEGGDSVGLFYRHLLRSSSPPSTDAALALTAAGFQGRAYFWDLYWRLMIMDDLSPESIVNAGAASVPNPALFRQEITSDAVSTAVERDVSLGTEIGFKGVPGVILCGQRTDGTPEDILENIRYLVDNAEGSRANE